MARHSERRLKVASLPWVIGALIFLGAIVAHLDFVPLFDAREYANCVVAATTRPFTLESLRCAEHPSHAYVAMLTVAELFARGSYVPVLLVNAALGIVALFAFSRILARVLPGDERALDRSLIGLCVAVHPVFVVSAIQLNLDFAVMVFFLVMLAAVMAERWLAAGLSGVLLTFSKEIGLLLFASTLALYLVMYVTREPGTLRDKAQRMRALAPALLPFACFGLYSIYRLSTASSWLWKGVSQRTLFGALTSFQLTDPVFVSYAVGLFVLHGVWIASLVISFDAIGGVVRWLFAMAPRDLDGLDRRRAHFVIVSFVLVAFFVTRFRTYTNVRYFLVAYPLLFAVFALSLIRLRLRSSFRRALVAAVAALLIVSNFRTVDLASRVAFGVFYFGEHEMLSVTSITNECCGHGRDQLVYNLEVTKLHDLQNDVFVDVAAGADTVFLVDRLARWFIGGPIDPSTHRRTLQRVGAVTPRFLAPDEAVASKPDRLYYLAFPYVERDIAPLLPYYDTVSTKRYLRSGYALDVTVLKKKGT